MKQFLAAAAVSFLIASVGVVLAQAPSAPRPMGDAAVSSSTAEHYLEPQGRLAGAPPSKDMLNRQYNFETNYEMVVGSKLPETYATNCAGCHGSDLKGGSAPSLFAESLMHARTDDQLRHTIAEGAPDAGMPAFKTTMSDDQIGELIIYLRYHSGELRTRPTGPEDNQVIHSQKQTFKLVVVASGLKDTTWSEVFLPDGRMLVTERWGQIRIIDKKGRLLPQPVKGTPTPWVRQDAGFFDITLSPHYKKDGWIYLSYAEMRAGYSGPLPPPPGEVMTKSLPPNTTVVVRGHLNAKNEWVDQQVVWKPAGGFYTSSEEHYGSRTVFDGKGHVFISMGDRGNMANAQNLASPLGKILRLNEDGTIPLDNPFINTSSAYSGADPAVWSYGHRNPEGLALDPSTGLLWESEHGPVGGDELNLIDEGHNYGWGVASMGIQTGITKQHAPGMDDPIVYFTGPSLGPGNLVFYNGDRYPGWKGNLFLGGMGGQRLIRFEVDGRKITSQEVMLEGYGAVRDIIVGPDGLLYLLIKTGKVVKLVPRN